MCDWREPCDWPDAYLIDRRPEPPARSCIKHLGALVLTPGVNWPLTLDWVGDVPLPQGLVRAKIHQSCMMQPFLETTPAMIFGTATEDPWASSDTGEQEAVGKT